LFIDFDGGYHIGNLACLSLQGATPAATAVPATSGTAAANSASRKQSVPRKGNKNTFEKFNEIRRR